MARREDQAGEKTSQRPIPERVINTAVNRSREPVSALLTFFDNTLESPYMRGILGKSEQVTKDGE